MAARGRPPNTERDAEIVRMFELDPDLTDTEVAFLFGLHRTRIQQIRIKAGIVRPRGMKPGAHPFQARDVDRNRQIVARYVAGELSGELSRRFDISTERVRQIVRAAGVAMRPGGKPRKAAPAEAIL